MNLIENPWIPIQQTGRFRHITMEELLTSEADSALALPRDDMESAALQLLIALTQTAFTPQDLDTFRERLREPMTPAEYRQGIEPLRDWFDLDHPDTPFMQTRGVEAKEPTPIQKLFIGLPEGNNHAFFNDVGEVGGVCPSCAAIAIFNQAVNAPGISGKHKAGIRGGSKVTTLVAGRTLRETVWLNVLTAETIARHFTEEANNHPVWISPIKKGSPIHAHEIGLLRGIFWQPLRMNLSPANPQRQVCDSCFAPISSGCHESVWIEADFKFEVRGLWLHPHSPRQWDLRRGNREKERYLSFNTSAPAWTQLNQYLINGDTHAQALVVEQCEGLSGNGDQIRLIVTGYRNNKASVTLRRHELFSIPMGWGEDMSPLENALDFALALRKILGNCLLGFSKKAGVVSTKKKANDFNEQSSAVAQFDKRSEPLVHELFTEMARRERKVALDGFRDDIKRLARGLFEQATAPYAHSPKGLATYTFFRNGFEKDLKELATL